MYRRWNYAPELATLTQRTISQLQNAGGMRLIRNKASADIITYYVQTGNNLSTQEKWYTDTQRDVASFSMQLFSAQYSQHDPVTGRGKRPLKSFASVNLLTNDKNVIAHLGNRAEMLKGIIFYCIILLDESNKQAIKVIETLKKEYRLK